jgi:hypothetical protein
VRKFAHSGMAKFAESDVCELRRTPFSRTSENPQKAKFAKFPYYSVVQKGWPLMHDEPSAFSNQLFGCQPLKAEGFLLGKVHPFRERL